jgi:hypothetical protein
MRLVLLCSTALFLFSLPASGQPASPAAALVGKLGDPNPAQREAAAAELRKLGKAAIAALETGLQSDDAEVRHVCTELLEAIRADRGPRAEAFLDGKDSVDPPYPGWAVFKERAGTDRVARLAYLDLAEANPAFVEQLEKNPKAVAAQANTLCTKFWNRQQPAQTAQAREQLFLTALIATSIETNTDPNAFGSFTTMLYQQDTRQLLAVNLVARRLVTRVLTARAAADSNHLLQTAYLANNLNLTEYIEGTLIPAALKMVDTLGDNPQDVNRMNQALQLVQAARLSTSLKGKLMPLVRKMAETAAKTVADGTALNNPNALYQASNACQMLGATEVVEEILKPAVRQLLLGSTKPEDGNRLYQAVNLARSLRLEAEMNQTVVPAVCRYIVTVAQHPEDENRFQTAVNLARQLNLNEALEGVLRPVGRQRILAALEQPGDFNRFSQAVYQARNLDLADLLEDTIKPLFARQAASLLKEPDFNRIQQLYYLSQNMGKNTFVEDLIKPAYLKHLKDLEARKAIDSQAIDQIYFARQLGCGKDLLPLARRAALAKEIAGHSRGMAVLVVLEFGGKEDLAALEPLLTDTANAGTMGFNQVTVTAEVRDVVLGGLIFKSGKSLADFGFPYFKAAPQVRPFDMPPSFLGFSSAAERTAAFKKWEESKKQADPGSIPH